MSPPLGSPPWHSQKLSFLGLIVCFVRKKLNLSYIMIGAPVFPMNCEFLKGRNKVRSVIIFIPLLQIQRGKSPCPKSLSWVSRCNGLTAWLLSKDPTWRFLFLKLWFQMVVCFFHHLFSLVTQHLKGEPQEAQVLSLLLVTLCGTLS